MNSPANGQIVRNLFLSLGAVLVVATQSRAHELITDISYESPGGLSNMLDIYTPDGGVNPDFPTLMYIHGGAWYTGKKEWNAPLHIALADMGYTVVSCNYTLSTQVSPSFPQAVHDVKAVVRWIRTTGIEKYHLSPVIVPFGTSAGGHLSMMLQATAGVDYFEPLSPPPGGYAVQAAISFFGPADLVRAAHHGFADDWRIVNFLGEAYSENTAKLWALASPITHLDENDPPLAIYHGIHDQTVPFIQSKTMQEAAVHAGILSWFFPYDGGHAFDPDLGGRPGAVLRMQQIIPALLAGDRKGNTPFTGGDFLTGRKISGVLSSIFHSDNQYLKAKSERNINGAGSQAISVVAKAELGIPDAKTIDISIESKLNVPEGTLTVFMKDFARNRSQKVGHFTVGRIETTQTLSDLKIDKFRNRFGDIEITFTFNTTSPAHNAGFEVWIDQVHVQAN